MCWQFVFRFRTVLTARKPINCFILYYYVHAMAMMTIKRVSASSWRNKTLSEHAFIEDKPNHHHEYQPHNHLTHTHTLATYAYTYGNLRFGFSSKRKHYHSQKMRTNESVCVCVCVFLACCR